MMHDRDKTGLVQFHWGLCSHNLTIRITGKLNQAYRSLGRRRRLGSWRLCRLCRCGDRHDKPMAKKVSSCLRKRTVPLRLALWHDALDCRQSKDRCGRQIDLFRRDRKQRSALCRPYHLEIGRFPLADLFQLRGTRVGLCLGSGGRDPYQQIVEVQYHVVDEEKERETEQTNGQEPA
jgi:hypothetical protein